MPNLQEHDISCDTKGLALSLRHLIHLTLALVFWSGVQTPESAEANPGDKSKQANGSSQSDTANSPIGVPPRKPPPPESSGAASTVGSYTREDRAAMDEMLAAFNGVVKQVKSCGVGAPVAEASCNKSADSPPPVRAVAQEVSPKRFSPPETGERFKPMSEVESYINCYLDENDFPPNSAGAKRIAQNRAAYFKRYKSIISTAAAEFQIPESYLTCLLFRENQFDLNNQSVKGAIGIAQLMPGTLVFISNWLTASANDEKSNKVDFFREALTKDDKSISLKRKEEARVHLMFHDLRKQWDSYFQKLKAQGKFKGAVPSKLNASSAKNPEIAIAASAYYMRFIIDQFEGSLNPSGTVDTDTTKDPDFDFLITVAGAYNMGHGGAAKALTGVRKPTAKKWREKLAKDAPGETKNHMISIANCLEKGSMKSPVGTKEKECPQ